jgi:hypothetical protein
MLKSRDKLTHLSWSNAPDLIKVNLSGLSGSLNRFLLNSFETLRKSNFPDCANIQFTANPLARFVSVVERN